MDAALSALASQGRTPPLAALLIAEGQRAARADADLQANPYSPGTWAARNWAWGWMRG